MEKTVKIDGKDVVLKASAYNLVLYRAEFGMDIFQAKADIFGALVGNRIELQKVDSLAVARMIWTMAKTADESLPGFGAWMRSIEDLPVVDLLSDNIELFISNMSQKSEIKKAPDTEPEAEEEI